ncbi:MAG TPA: L,D-transpeptidase family protein [Thauera sp.]|uniref:L,D-transpeptidase family protein n=1 Tax=Thauera sp. TaxID=1905334 RepID=UPI001D2105C0|nr:L,D-transpeptidase family protein [Thauera sp.]MCB1945245.1 L,D-transpeptidase family protein [Thauera sp.]HRV79091.1 L,D-transpeptidase family protein [Thauera sp.]
MNNKQSEQALEDRILIQSKPGLGKSFVTFATLAALALLAPGVHAMAAGEAAPVAIEPATGDSALALRIEQRLRERAAMADETTALFYLARAYRPVWTEPARAEALLAAVDALRGHGLDPADFAPLRLRAALPAEADPDRAAERELLFTDTLAALLFQLRYGKVDPHALYREWNFTPPPNPYERAGELARVLQAPDLAAAVEAQAPDLPLYRALRAELLAQQGLLAGGDWPRVAAGPTLKPGARSARVPSLRARLAAAGESVLDARDKSHYDEALVEAVERFQAAHGLQADGVLGAQTLEALNASPAQRVAQIRANLERLRWVAGDLQGDRLLVDIVGYHADLVLDGQPVWASRVIVGKPRRRTPSLLDSVTHLVLNPKWVVPPTILREDVIPGAARNPSYLANRRMRVVDRSGQTVDPSTIDWSGARQSGFPYRIEQQSGASGSLGRIKFSLSNPYVIYLHDTNTRSLFKRAERALSSGCVRVEKPEELAVVLLADAERWSAQALQAALDSGRTRTLDVGRDVKVLLHYATAALDDAGKVLLRNDIYGYDAAIVAALDAPVR